MAKDSDNRAGSFETGNTGGFISGFLAEEDEFDRRKLWRLGSWAAASVGAVIVALLASQTSIGLRHEQIAVADLARQSLQIQSVAKESQGEARRLASAIETLNSDRDRLYSRVAVLEQGLDSVTGTIARQNPPVTAPQAASPAASPVTTAAPAPAAPVLAAPGPAASAEPPAPAQKPSPAPIVTPVAATTATTAEKPPVVITAAEPGPAPASSGAQAASNAPAAPAATPLVALKSMMAPPDPAAGKLFEPSPSLKAITAAPMPEVLASTAPAEDAIEADTAPKLAVQRTEFGVDVGGANSLPGLRALWRGLLKSRSNAALTKLRPIIVIKEGSNGLGMQLRLVAGPISDAAAAADVCAAIIENDRACAITVFEGQRLAMNADEPATGADAKPQAADIKPGSAAKPGLHRHYTLKRTAEPAPKQESSTLSRMFGTR
jgi:hypothetical protein